MRLLDKLRRSVSLNAYNRLFCLKTIDTLNRVGITTLDCFSLLIICYATADATKMPTTHYDNNAFAVVVS